MANERTIFKSNFKIGMGWVNKQNQAESIDNVVEMALFCLGTNNTRINVEVYEAIKQNNASPFKSPTTGLQCFLVRSSLLL